MISKAVDVMPPPPACSRAPLIIAGTVNPVRGGARTPDSVVARLASNWRAAGPAGTPPSPSVGIRTGHGSSGLRGRHRCAGTALPYDYGDSGRRGRIAPGLPEVPEGESRGNRDRAGG